MIMIAAALPVEIAPLRQRALPGVSLAALGMGREAVEKELKALLEAQRPELLISAGFAGGLQPDLKAGDAILAERLRSEDGQEIEIEEELFHRASRAAVYCHSGSLLTVSRPARTIEEKDRLRREHAALAVDMESFWGAAAARACRVPFLAVRAILDPLECSLPAFIESLDPRGHWSWRTALALARRPWQLGSLAQLAGAARLASRRLALALEALVSAFAVEVARC